MADVITIPVSATYRIINGEAVQVSAEHTDVSADFVARFLLERFGIPGKAAN